MNSVVKNQLNDEVMDNSTKLKINTEQRIERKVDALGRGYGTGRAKSDSVARVWISISSSSKKVKKTSKKTDENEVVSAPEIRINVNNQDAKEYFKRDSLIGIISKPVLCLRGIPGDVVFNVICTVSGGGLAGQAKALSLGIARGLVVLNPEFKLPMRENGLLTRGPIGKEREKYGRRGARADLPYSRR